MFEKKQLEEALTDMEAIYLEMEDVIQRVVPGATTSIWHRQFVKNQNKVREAFDKATVTHD